MASVRQPLLAGELVADKPAATCILADGAQEADAHVASKVQWKLTVALILCFAFMILEVVGGILANSLAILTDAAHLLSDVSGFGMSLFAAWYAARKSHSTHTFGYHRVEVLGALASVLSIWLVTGILVYEAVDRIINPVRVNGKLMFFLALAGCAVNLINLFVLDSHVGHSHSHGEGDGGCGGQGHSHGHSSHGAEGAPANGHAHSHEHDAEAGLACHGSGSGSHACHDHGSHDHSGHDHSGHDLHGSGSGGHSGHSHGSGSHGHSHGEGSNINLRSAVLHIIGDLVQSIGVAAAGALIWWKQDDPRFQIADPICTFIFALLVLWTTRLILQDISDILMERVPRHLDVAAIQDKLLQVPGVTSVFDLHVWALKPSIPLLAAHVEVEPGADGGRVLADVTTACRLQGITHTTIQICDEGHGEGCQTRLPPGLEAPGLPAL